MEGDGDIGERPGLREGALRREDEDEDKSEDEFGVEMFCLKSRKDSFHVEVGEIERVDTKASRMRI